MTFADLDLEPRLLAALEKLGYEEPTPIQQAIIPALLKGADVIGRAQTGTGKTAAYALPMLHNLDPAQGEVQGLVLAPTRELALQVAGAIRGYGSKMGVKVAAIYGGQSYGLQINNLKRGVDIVAGTPGRLLDMMDRGLLDISAISTLVLDEADEMLSMGFIEDIGLILDQAPPDRQMALLSATMPPAIRRLAGQYLKDPQIFSMADQQLTAEAVTLRCYLVNPGEKTTALTRLLEVEGASRSLVFARTRQATASLAEDLTKRGFPAEALNGDLGQEARERVLGRFRQGLVQILVATDVAARGLDIDDISHVFNYDLPEDPEVYVHRIGRTGRAGKSGLALSLLTPGERRLLYRIESFLKQRIDSAPLPRQEEIEVKREEALLEQLAVWLRRSRFKRELEMVTALAEEGHDPLEIAAAALKMARQEERKRPIEPLTEVRLPKKQRFGQPGRDGTGRRKAFTRQSRASRAGDKDMIRLVMSLGSKDGLKPAQVVGGLAHEADIPGYSLGRISIGEQETFVDVPKQYVGQVLARSGLMRLGRRRVLIVKA